MEGLQEKPGTDRDFLHLLSNMLPFTNKSLLLRMGLAMATLRMQSYRIASALAQELHAEDLRPAYAKQTDVRAAEFEMRLLDARLVSVVPKNPTDKLAVIYNHIFNQWQTRIKPLFFGPDGESTFSPTGEAGNERTL